MTNEHFLLEFCDKRKHDGIISEELHHFYQAFMLNPDRKTCADLVMAQKIQINAKGKAACNGYYFNIE
jgi:hypothetical protein